MLHSHHRLLFSVTLSYCHPTHLCVPFPATQSSHRSYKDWATCSGFELAGVRWPPEAHFNQNYSMTSWLMTSPLHGRSDSIITHAAIQAAALSTGAGFCSAPVDCTYFSLRSCTVEMFTPVQLSRVPPLGSRLVWLMRKHQFWEISSCYCDKTWCDNSSLRKSQERISATGTAGRFSHSCGMILT